MELLRGPQMTQGRNFDTSDLIVSFSHLHKVMGLVNPNCENAAVQTVETQQILRRSEDKTRWD